MVIDLLIFLRFRRLYSLIYFSALETATNPQFTAPQPKRLETPAYTASKQTDITRWSHVQDRFLLKHSQRPICFASHSAFTYISRVYIWTLPLNLVFVQYTRVVRRSVLWVARVLSSYIRHLHEEPIAAPFLLCFHGNISACSAWLK